MRLPAVASFIIALTCIRGSFQNAVEVFGENGCASPLGMETGFIPDRSLSASSSYDFKSVGPMNARIRQDQRGGAWCPKNQITAKTREFLEIDLEDDHIITATETQGRFGKGVGQEFSEAYFVEYWRKSIGRWITYVDYNGSKILTGNTNTFASSLTKLDLPFVASKVRFFPYSEHPRTACLRVELYGCPGKQNLEQYIAPPGGTMTLAAGALLTDVSYDGNLVDGLMMGGLGQLTDSLFGFDDFELQYEGDIDGSKWVGWSKASVGGGPLELQFNFKEARNFTSVTMHVNNMFTKDVQLFLEAEVHFSMDGNRWQKRHEGMKPKQDRVSERARFLTVNLRNRTAQFIKLKLHYSHKWIMLSEAYFVSEPSQLNITHEFVEEYYKADVPPPEDPELNDSTRILDLRGKIPLGLMAIAFAALLVTAGTVGLIFTNRGRRKVSLLNKLNSPPVPPPRPPHGYREPYSLCPEQYPGKIEDQHEYNEIIDGRYIKCPVTNECYYTSTEIPQTAANFEPEVSTSRVYIETGQFTCIRLPRAEPPAGVTQLLVFPRRKLRPLETLGHTPYGYLQVCEGEGIDQTAEEMTRSNSRRKKIMLVKTLSRGYTQSTKTNFIREITWLAGLRHPNMTGVIGLSLEDPPCAAFERGELGELPELLRRDQDLSCGSLIHIVTQIASGMKFLESLELVHRDLAARNCTVSRRLGIKVSDHAIHSIRYRGDYTEGPKGQRIPLRWMSWESILLGQFSPASDVWSFGCTLWEVLTRCAARPLYELTSQQVIENAEQWRAGSGDARAPARPERCPRELYDLMHECWRRDPELRPRFAEIHLFLQRKTTGFIPPD